MRNAGTAPGGVDGVGRMTRLLLNLLTALSLLLCVAMCVLWVRSCWRSDALGYEQRCTEEDPHGDYWLNSSRGRMTFMTAMLDTDGKETGPFWHTDPPGDPYRWDQEGSYVLAWSLENYPGQSMVSTPHWVVAALLAIVPAAVVLARFVRTRRRLQGLCTSCGYDLRATPDRCPECGRAAG
jgi:hypothetical protein